MSGVLRPYTLVDVLGTLNQQTSTDDTGQGTQVGNVAEADETVTSADSASGTAAAPVTWDGGVWGAGQWS